MKFYLLLVLIVAFFLHDLQGYDVYLVGGCVRDLILKRTPKDFDILTSAELREVGFQSKSHLLNIVFIWFQYGFLFSFVMSLGCSDFLKMWNCWKKVSYMSCARWEWYDRGLFFFLSMIFFYITNISIAIANQNNLLALS